MMKISDIRDAIIPLLSAYCGVPVIEADQMGDMPSGPHATYKFTSPYVKDVGMAEETVEYTSNTVVLRHAESFKVTLSLSAYAMDIDESIDLATKMYEWFKFYGYDDLEAADIAVVELRDVENRDTFVVDDYEYRNGFDVILRVSKELTQDVGYIEKVEINDKLYE